MNKTLILVRGLPGSGKTWLASLLAVPDAALAEERPTNENLSMFAADDYFTNSQGEYNFDPEQIADAHQWCMGETAAAMERGISRVVVHNTFTQAWEAQTYRELADEFGYTVFVVTCENDFGNTHGVPDEGIARMAERWEHRI